MTARHAAAPTAKSCSTFGIGTPIALAVTILLALATPAQATPIAVLADPPPPKCVEQTLDKYLALIGGCTIDDKIFARFEYSQTAGGIAANAVTVTPSVQPDGADIAFAGKWTGTLLNSITYSVQTVSGKKLIEDALLSVDGSATTMKASFTITEPLCLNRTSFPMLGCAKADSEVLIDSTLPNTSRTFAKFGPVAQLAVMDNISLSVFAGGGEVSVTKVDNFFSEIPEPGSNTLLGSGVLGLAAVLRRKLIR
jgi:hypothetical protein